MVELITVACQESWENNIQLIFIEHYDVPSHVLSTLYILTYKNFITTFFFSDKF